MHRIATASRNPHPPHLIRPPRRSRSRAVRAAIVTTGIKVGDSNADLPLSGTLAATSAELGEPLTLTDPGPQEGLAGVAASLAVEASDSTSGQTPTFTATGLPTGVSISGSGTVSGTPTAAGSSTVTVTAKDADGAQAGTSFVWTVEPAAAGIAATPLIGYGGLCLDAHADSNAPGTAVDVYICNGTNGQQWTVEPDGTIQANGDCLDVVSGGTANGTLVDLYGCNGTGAQNWAPQPDGALLNPPSGTCLDDTDFGGSGTQLELYTCNNGSNQQWSLP